MSQPSIPISQSDLKSDADEFHSSFRIFLNAVEMLAASAEQQCEVMGNYNVGWELKEDVAAGQFLVGRGYLSATEESWVAALAKAVQIVNAQVLPAGPGKDANLQAMRHECWAPLRFLAREVHRQLSTFAESNANYLHLPTHAA